MDKILALFRLTRAYVFLPFSFLSAMIGLRTLYSPDDVVKFLLIGLSLSCALIASFSYNDIEDEKDDAMSEFPRNPITTGLLTKGTGYSVALFFAVTSLILSSLVSVTTLVSISFILTITLLYSWRSVRLKSKPPWDVLTHALVISTMFLASAWSQKGIYIDTWIITISLGFASGGAVAILTHQAYEYIGDLNANITTTTTELGVKKALFINVGFAIVLFSTIVYSVFMRYLPVVPIASFVFVIICFIGISLLVPRSKRKVVSKKVFPWAVNFGAVVAIISWLYV